MYILGLDLVVCCLAFLLPKLGMYFPVPDMSIHGVLNKLHATVDVSTYELIRGLLSHNLGETVPEIKLQPSFLSLQQAAKPHRKVCGLVLPDLIHTLNHFTTHC